MTMVACGLQEYPRTLMQPANVSSGGAAQTFALDSTSDALAWVGTSPVAGDLAVIYFRTGSIPGGGGDTVDIRIETVANGRPTGTLWAVNTNITVAIADTDDNLWKTATLTAAATLALGDEFAIVIISSAGTPNIVLAGTPAIMCNTGQYPIILHNATGAYAVQAFVALEWIASFTTIGLVYLPGLAPLDGALTLTAFNSGSSPNARALRFQVPFKCRCVGARLFIGNLAAVADVTFTVSLFDATGDTDAEALGQKVLNYQLAAANTNDGYIDVFFDEVDANNVLTINTTYYIELRPDTTDSLTLFEATTAGTGEPAGAIGTFPQKNTQMYLQTRTWAAGTAGAWDAAVTTTYPLISILIDQLDDGASTGGGGMRLAGRGGLAAS